MNYLTLVFIRYENRYYKYLSTYKIKHHSSALLSTPSDESNVTDPLQLLFTACALVSYFSDSSNHSKKRQKTFHNFLESEPTDITHHQIDAHEEEKNDEDGDEEEEEEEILCENILLQMKSEDVLVSDAPRGISI